MTGILRVSKESIFSGLNNLEIYSILDEQYSEYFGFVPREVENILEEYNVENKEEIKNGMMDIILEEQKYIIHGVY